MGASHIALVVVVVLKGAIEIVLLTLAGQAALWLLAGRHRHTNLVYGAFRIVGDRVFALCRRITPASVPDRHIPLIAVFWLILIELLLIVAKVYLVLGSATRIAH
jgi:hypothetical protein